MNENTDSRRQAAADMAARLDELMKRAGISGRELAKAVGIGYASFLSMRNGKTEPGFTLPIILADFFAVPLDYLCGRCDEATARAILEDYPKNFMQVRLDSYEEYLQAHRALALPNGYETPWPYNLVEAAGVQLPDPMIRTDQDEGLACALGTLPPRTRDILLRHYRDGEPLASIGKSYELSQERIRQIVAKGVKLLRHPSRKVLIEEGYDEAFARERAVLQKRRAQFAEDCAKLDQDIAVLDEKRRLMILLRGRLDGLAQWDEERRKLPDDGGPASKDFPVDGMDMTVRANNVLSRAGIRTLGQMVEAYQSGRLLQLRCMGRKTYKEVTEKMRCLLALDSVDDLNGIKVWT